MNMGCWALVTLASTSSFSCLSALVQAQGTQGLDHNLVFIPHTHVSEGGEEQGVGGPGGCPVEYFSGPIVWRYSLFGFYFCDLGMVNPWCNGSCLHTIGVELITM